MGSLDNIYNLLQMNSKFLKIKLLNISSALVKGFFRLTWIRTENIIPRGIKKANLLAIKQ